MKKTLLFLLIFISISFSQYPESIKWWHLSQSVKDSINQISNNSGKKPTWQLYEQFTKFTGGLVGLSPSVPVSPKADYFSGNYNRIYFVFNSPYQNNNIEARNYVYYYDIDTGEISKNYVAIGSGAPSNDSYGGAAILVNNYGNVIVAMDSVLANPDRHNNGIILRYSDPEDITKWNLIPRLRNPGGTIADGTFPSLFKFGQDTVFLIHQYGLSSSNHYRNAIYKSIDAGKTFGPSQILLSTLDNDTNFWAQPFIFEMRDSAKVGLIVNVLDWTTVPLSKNHYIYVYYLETYNGEKWYNADHSYSKNVYQSGEISRSELQSYFRMNWNQTDSIWQVIKGDFSPDGRPYFVGRRVKYPPADSAFYTFAFWDGSSWIKKEIGKKIQMNFNLNYIRPVNISVYDSSKIDIWIKDVDPNITTKDSVRLQRWRTIDAGDNWYIIEDYPLPYSKETIGGFPGGNVGFAGSGNDPYLFFYIKLATSTTNYLDVKGFIYEKKY